MQISMLHRLIANSLVRSLRVRLVSAIAFVFAVIAVLAIHARGEHGARVFATTLALVPISLLANVLLVNALGIDGNTVLALRGAPVTLARLCSLRLTIPVMWVIAVLLPVWIFGVLFEGFVYLPIMLLQLGLLFTLAGVGTVSSVVMPVPRPYGRVGAQTAPLPVQLVVMLVSLGFIGAAILLRRVPDEPTQIAMAAGLATLGGAVWALVSLGSTSFLIARRERIIRALLEVTQ